MVSALEVFLDTVKFPSTGNLSFSVTTSNFRISVSPVCQENRLSKFRYCCQVSRRKLVSPLHKIEYLLNMLESLSFFCNFVHVFCPFFFWVTVFLSFPQFIICLFAFVIILADIFYLIKCISFPHSKHWIMVWSVFHFQITKEFIHTFLLGLI